MPIKNDKETYEQIIEMEGNNDYAAGNLLDYEFFKTLQINCNRFKETN